MANLKEYRRYYQKCINARLFVQRLSRVSEYLSESVQSKNYIVNDFCLNHPNRILMHIRRNESGSIYVNEGLIRSFPVNSLIKAFKSWFRKNIDPEFENLSF